MDTILLNQIPFQPDLDTAAAALRIREGTSGSELLGDLLEQAAEVARPKALARPALIEDRDEDRVLLEGIAFHSRILRVNTEDVNRVFAFIATCGTELEAWKDSFEDMITAYYADQINQLALTSARDALEKTLVETFQLGETSTMNPGSLSDWPISEQRPLFQLLGDPEETIGVKLLPSMLMSPGQSVSGLRFASDQEYYNCQLCPIENCPHRKAPFQPDLYNEQYSGK